MKITLKQAFDLCKIEDSEIVHLRDAGASRWYSIPYTGKEIRNKCDMKTIKVVAINPYFSFGEYEGFEFETEINFK